MSVPASPVHDDLDLATDHQDLQEQQHHSEELHDVQHLEYQYEPPDEAAHVYDSPSGNVDETVTLTTTRTVAIIKTHALEHRFDIEPRISEAGFEIVKERQMEFDVETDPETMYELFGDDYVSFAEGPVWVYVLERRRAVEVWNTLMGNPDPVIARQESLNSLRALYGLSREQNAIMGSPDAQTAEMQILAIFASSPPFPTTDLPDVVAADSHQHLNHLDVQNGGTLRDVTASILESLQQQTGTTFSNGHPTSSTARSTSSAGKKTISVTSDNTTTRRQSTFKARALPPTHDKPDIAPRMSRAAALRQGIILEAPKRVAATKESLAKTFGNVPGHKRSVTITVASTAPPVVAPRMTKAASLRLGQKPPEKPAMRARASTAGPTLNGGDKGKGEKKDTFEGVPGHKRRESIAVASTKPPTVVPRLNKSASLRVQKDNAPPPSSFMFRGPAQPLSRSSSRTSTHTPSATGPRPSLSSRPASAASSTRPPPIRRTTSSSHTTDTQSRTSAFTSATSSTSPTDTADTAVEEKPAKPKAPRPSSIGAPTIAPRQNKSAMLRAAKMAATNAADANGNGKTVKKPVARTVKAL